MSVRINKILALALLTTVTFAVANPALAQQQNEISANPIEGVTITSNNDGTAGETLSLIDNNVTVFNSAQGNATTITSNGNVTLEVDTDEGGAGVFQVIDHDGGNASTTTIQSDAVSTLLQTGGGNSILLNGSGVALNGGLDNTNDGITNAGAISGVTNLTTNGNTVLGDAAGDTTAINGVTTINGSINANTNINTGTSTGTVAIGNSASTTNVLGTTNINATGAAATNVGTGTGAVTVGNTTGAAAINGSTVTSTGATTNSMVSGDNSVVVNNTANTVTLTADSDATAGNGRSVITAGPTSASMLVTTAAGVSHGVNVSQTATTISGGTASTTLTLDDSGATFANTTTGGPARVMGVADGVNDFDAVNMRQFNTLQNDMQEAEGGIANVAAMANIPQVDQGKNFSVGAGYGNFKGENAMALGGSARFSENVVAKASVGYSSESSTTVGGGVSYSW